VRRSARRSCSDWRMRL